MPDVIHRTRNATRLRSMSSANAAAGAMTRVTIMGLRDCLSVCLDRGIHRKCGEATRSPAVTGASAACGRRPVKAHAAARPCDPTTRPFGFPACTPPDRWLAAEHGPRRRDGARRAPRPASGKHAVRSVRKKDSTVISLKPHANSGGAGSYRILQILPPIRRRCAAWARVEGIKSRRCHPGATDRANPISCERNFP
jgi:hypothetical protein